MADVVDRETRSRMMSGIRAKDTKPELRLRKALFALGFRYRLHARDLPGQPDIVLPKWRAAILVHGCFWHRHPGCRLTTHPATRPEFWNSKFHSNVERDSRNLERLREQGWRTAVVWECCLRPRGAADEIAVLIRDWLHSGSERLELPDAGSPGKQKPADFSIDSAPAYISKER